MGRRSFRRKSKHDKPSDSSACWSHHHHKEALLQYLQDYRDGVEASYHGRDLFETCSEDDVCIIGGVVLPALTKEVLDEPFLELPKLSPKQRRMTHECCLEVDLFHASIGSSRHSRRMAISLYADGLKAFVAVTQPDGDSSGSSLLAQQEHRPKIYTYSPWYCKNHASGDTKLNSSEKQARQQISALLAQPGDCLRDDGVDTIQFDSTKLDDLSHLTFDPLPSGTSIQSNKTFVLVDSAGKMKDCIAQLEQAKPTEIAFDLECYNPSKYAQICCLLQVTCNSLDIDFIIDTLAPGVWPEVSGLAPLFANPGIVKVGHSIGSLDITSLHRDFGIFCVNAFDTYEAAKVLNLPGKGLGDVCQFYGMRQADRYKRLKETYQACDWRVRPLTAPMVQYARYDVHYLLALRRIMMRDLVLLDRGSVDEEAQHPDVDETVEAEASSPEPVAADEGRSLGSGDDTPKKKNRSLLSIFRGNSPPKPAKQARSGVDGHQRTPPQSPVKSNGTELCTAHSDDQNEHNDASLDCKPISCNQNTSELFFFTPEKSAPSSLSGSIGREQFWTPENIPGKIGRPFTADAQSLLQYPKLMDVIAKSQKSCKAFFTLSREPHAKNTLFITLLQRAAKHHCGWTNYHTKLYAELAAWRVEAAARMQCLPGFVASLEFLAGVAWKGSHCIDGLKLIASDLPDALADNESLCHEIFAIVEECFPGASQEKLYYFENKQRRNRRLQMMRSAAVSTLTVSAGLICILLYTRPHRKLGR